MSTRRNKFTTYQTESVIAQIETWFVSRLWGLYTTQIAQRLRRDKPHAIGVRLEVAALIERNMDDRPDLWADLARH